MIYVKDRAAIDKARAAFRKKWQRRCPRVVESLDEAGDDLFTFGAFPPSQWKALRTTNALERINEEFRRRTKTQASLPSQDALLLLLFAPKAGHEIRHDIAEKIGEIGEHLRAQAPQPAAPANGPSA
jgi:transposase-like protein